jgi:hypothetical protein
MLLAHRKAHLPVPPLRTQLQAAVVAVAVDMKAVVVVDIKAAVAADGTNP